MTYWDRFSKKEAGRYTTTPIIATVARAHIYICLLVCMWEGEPAGVVDELFACATWYRAIRCLVNTDGCLKGREHIR